MRTINEEPVDGQGPALAITIEFGEQLKPYKSQNQFYINILEKSYREIRRAETLPLIRKAVEYLETHPFIAQDDEVLYAAQDYGIGEIKAGVLKTDDYSDKYSTYPDGFKHNAYGTVGYSCQCPYSWSRFKACGLPQ